MAVYKVEFKGAAWFVTTVEVDGDENDAIEAALDAGPIPRLCSHCSGYDQDWSLEIPDSADGWDPDAGSVTKIEG